MNITALTSTHHQVDLFGVTESTEKQQAIIAHTIEAIQSLITMRESAVKLCVSLYHCRDSFAQSGETGWESFCEANFAKLGLSQSTIRASVKAGRAIAHHMLQAANRGEPPVIAQLEAMSRSALFVLGDAPDEVRDDLIERVMSLNEARGGKAMSSGEVEREMNNLLRAKAELQDELAASQEKLSLADQALTRLNGRLLTEEGLVAEHQAKIQLLQSQLSKVPKTPVEVVESDPQSAEARAQRQALEHQLSQLSHEQTIAERRLAETQAELAEANRQAEAAKRAAAYRKSTAADIEDLHSKIAALKAVWTDVYTSKQRAADPATFGPLLSGIANDLRGMADSIDPMLI
jgi:hypothetical protein